MKIVKPFIISFLFVLGLYLIASIFDQLTHPKLNNSNLITLNDQIRSIEKLSVMGYKGYYDVILIELINTPLKFKIQDENLELINQEQILNISYKNQIQIQINKKQLERAINKSWYFFFMKWNKNPEIYSLNIDDIQIYTKDEFEILNITTRKIRSNRAIVLLFFLFLVIFIKLMPKR